MRTFFFCAVLSFTIFSCNSKKETPKVENSVQSTILEKIADAHGFQNWNKVSQLDFTFNVDRDSMHFERSWSWKPKQNIVKSMTTQDTLVYQRNAMDSIATKANAGFINDRYWLLAPFNLIWDQQNFEYEHQKEALAPLSKKACQKLTIVYGKEGGYTPGDAYDFYFGDDYLIKEWVFRKTNQVEASMTTTWENYQEKNGIKFAVDHKKDGEPFNLYFSNVIVQPKE